MQSVNMDIGKRCILLLLGQKQAALIDTGLGIDNIKRITDQLTDLPIAVITTHVHADHIGSHGQFETIYVHKEDEDWLINGIKRLVPCPDSKGYESRHHPSCS